MIPVVRGSTANLDVMLHGNPETNTPPAREFLDECNKFPGLLKTAMQLEGLVCGRSVHASGVIIFETKYTDHSAMMKAPSRQPVTQWDMDDSTYCGGLKFDYLTIQNLDAMHICMDMLLKYGLLEWKGNLRKTYNFYFHPDVLDYESVEMWEMAERLEIVNLFQFQTPVGSRAIQSIKPRSLVELGTANATMRLMVEKKEGDLEEPEQPINTFIRYKNDIQEWYTCMRDKYNLIDEEIKIVEKYLKSVHGMASMQEEVMQLCMDENISNFSMEEANYLRKAIAKKKKKLQKEAKSLFYKKGREIGTRDNLLNYVWKEVVEKQLGYSFSLPHIVGYSTIALQEMNQAYRYPIIYWNTANLIVDAAADEEQKDKNQSTNYGKIATAISNMQKSGIEVTMPLINEAKYEYIPDEANNRIIYSFKSLCGIGDETADIIIKNQPYESFEDFCERLVDTKLLKNSHALTLIKAGSFTELDNPDRTKTMEKYIRKYIYSPLKSLTISQLSSLKEFELLPEELNLASRMKDFEKYVLDDINFIKTVIIPKKKIPKKGYHDRIFVLDDNSMPFFKENFSENSIVGIQDQHYLISEKAFSKEVEKIIEPLREWLAKPESLELYNNCLFRKSYEKYASGTIPKWEMDSLSFYYTEHEMAHVDNAKYGIEDFFQMPEDPIPYDFYYRFINGERKSIPKNRITRIAGTVLDNDKNRHTVTLLTPTGVVNCKFSKGQYVFYSKTISEPNPDNPDKKIVRENSWFKRGTKLLVCGYRSEDVFRAYRYQDTLYLHTVALVTNIEENGFLSLRQERYQIGQW